MNNSLLPREREILLGSILGDSWISKTNKGYEHVWFSHSDKQKNYLQWKYDNLPSIRCNKITEYHYKNGNYIRYQFCNRYNSKVTNFIKSIAYEGNSKHVTRKYLNLLTPLSLAVWWMDDGCLSIYKPKGERYGKLCTHSFTLRENELIKKYFSVVWNIECKIKIEKQKYYFIRFNATEMKKLINIIYPYVLEIPSMVYKIDMQYVNKTYPYNTITPSHAEEDTVWTIV